MSLTYLFSKNVARCHSHINLQKTPLDVTHIFICRKHRWMSLTYLFTENAARCHPHIYLQKTPLDVTRIFICRKRRWMSATLTRPSRMSRWSWPRWTGRWSAGWISGSLRVSPTPTGSTPPAVAGASRASGSLFVPAWPAAAKEGRSLRPAAGETYSLEKDQAKIVWRQRKLELQDRDSICHVALSAVRWTKRF